MHFLVEHWGMRCGLVERVGIVLWTSWTSFVSGSCSGWSVVEIGFLEEVVV